MYPSEKEVLSFAEKFLIGAAVGCVTTAAVEPLVYVKDRWQQSQPLSPNPKVFYRGLFVNALGFVPTMAIQNSVFGHTCEYLDHMGLDDTSKKIGAAVAAGTASTVISCPSQLLIIRQQNFGGTCYQVSKKIVLADGYKGLFRAFVPTAVRNSSFAGFFFVATPTLSEYVKEYTDNRAIQAVVPSVLAGAMSSLLTQPCDTLKTCMQADLENKSAKQIAQQIYCGIQGAHHAKGVKNFYYGLSPRVAAVAASMTIEYNLRNSFTKQYLDYKKS